MKPNITEALLNMPGDFSHMITNRLSELRPKETIGWTIFKHTSASGISVRGKYLIKKKGLEYNKRLVIINNCNGLL